MYTGDAKRTGALHASMLKAALPFFLYAAFLTGGFLLFQHVYPRMHVDEQKHRQLIRTIIAGDFSFEEMERIKLPMIPGYHFAVASWAKLFGVGPRALRWITFLHALLLIPAAALSARTLGKEGWTLRSMHVLLLPWLPVMTWIVYTDVASMVYVLFGFYFWREKRLGLSSVALMAACLIRHNNVIWAIAFAAIHLFEKEETDPARRPTARRDRLWKTWPFAVPVLVVAGFLIFQGGLVMAHAEANPSRPHPSQVAYLGLLMLLWLAPTIATDLGRQARRWRERLRTKPHLWLPLIAGAVLLYYFSLDFTHLSNQDLRMSGGAYFNLDNVILAYLDMNLITRILGFVGFWVVCEYVVCSIRSSTRPVLAAGILTASVAYLLPSWMITSRYDLLPLAFFGLLCDRPVLSNRITLAWNLALAAAVTRAVLMKRLFW